MRMTKKNLERAVREAVLCIYTNCENAWISDIDFDYSDGDPAIVSISFGFEVRDGLGALSWAEAADIVLGELGGRKAGSHPFYFQRLVGYLASVVEKMERKPYDD
jgi:hypothetical protein